MTHFKNQLTQTHLFLKKSSNVQNRDSTTRGKDQMNLFEIFKRKIKIKISIIDESELLVQMLKYATDFKIWCSNRTFQCIGNAPPQENLRLQIYRQWNGDFFIWVTGLRRKIFKWIVLHSNFRFFAFCRKLVLNYL